MKKHERCSVKTVPLPLFPAWKIVGLASWAAVVLTIYFQDSWLPLSNLSAMADTLTFPTAKAFLAMAKPLALAAWLSILCILMGHRLLHWMRIPFREEIDRTVFAGGLGAGALILILFFVGLAGFWRPGELWALSLALTGLLAAFHRKLWRVEPLPEPPPKHSLRLVDKAMFLFILLFLGCYLLEALAPEIFYDAMVYHLAIPHQWLLAHRILPTPYNLYSGIPFNMEVLYGLGMAFSTPVLAKLLHVAAGIGCLATIWAMSRRYASARAGLAACLIFVSSPMVALEFGKTAVELGTALFGLLSVYALLLAQAEFDPAMKRRWLVLGGLFCGFCMGTKYTSFILFPALICAQSIHWLLEKPRYWKALLADLCLLALPAALVVSPWLIKNMLFYKNPLYPFLQTLFHNGSAVSNLKELLSDGGGRNLKAQFSSVKGIWEYLIEPWTVTMTGRTDADFIGPAYLALLPLALFSFSKTTRTLLWVFGIQWILYSLSSHLVRFRIPALAVLAVLLAIGLADGRYPKWLKNTVLFVVFLIAIGNFTWANVIQYSMDGWKVTLGLTPVAEYLNHPHDTYPTPYYSAAEYISKETPADAKVLILGDGRSLYIERPFVNATLFDEHPFFRWANASGSGEQLARRLQEEGITHILLNAAEAMRVRQYWKGAFTDAGQAAFEQFWQKHTHLVFKDLGARSDGRFTFVYAVVPDRAKLEPGVPETQNIFGEILARP